MLMRLSQSKPLQTNRLATTNLLVSARIRMMKQDQILL
jgi:hypothetical protein